MPRLAAIEIIWANGVSSPHAKYNAWVEPLSKICSLPYLPILYLDLSEEDDALPAAYTCMHIAVLFSKDTGAALATKLEQKYWIRLWGSAAHRDVS